MGGDSGCKWGWGSPNGPVSGQLKGSEGANRSELWGAMCSGSIRRAYGSMPVAKSAGLTLPDCKRRARARNVCVNTHCICLCALLRQSCVHEMATVSAIKGVPSWRPWSQPIPARTRTQHGPARRTRWPRREQGRRRIGGTLSTRNDNSWSSSESRRSEGGISGGRHLSPPFRNGRSRTHRNSLTLTLFFNKTTTRSGKR